MTRYDPERGVHGLVESLTDVIGSDDLSGSSNQASADAAAEFTWDHAVEDLDRMLHAIVAGQG